MAQSGIAGRRNGAGAVGPGPRAPLADVSVPASGYSSEASERVIHFDHAKAIPSIRTRKTAIEIATINHIGMVTTSPQGYAARV